MKKEFNIYEFADWFLDTANQTVKHYKGDILFDAKRIFELRNEHLNTQKTEHQVFSIYWGLRETGTWLYHVNGDNVFSISELMILGAKCIYLINFVYDASGNETIIIHEVDTISKL